MTRKLALLILLMFQTLNAFPHDGPHAGHALHGKTFPVVSVSFGPGGRLWRAAVSGGFVQVDYSDDQGKTYSQPVKVNAEAENIWSNGENRPKIVATSEGKVYVSYTEKLGEPMSGNIKFSRSLDAGATFSTPAIVNDDRGIISHRFDSMVVDNTGKVTVAWVDERDQVMAKSQNRPYSGGAIYYAVSEDDGAQFKPNIKVADSACECCRVAMVKDGEGKAIAFWRHIYNGNIRDHAFARLEDRPVLTRVSHDNWRIDACPHQGPAIAIGPDNVYHFVWYTGAEKRSGFGYTQSSDKGITFTPAVHFGNAAMQPSRVDVLSLGRQVFIVWKEFDGQNTQVMLRQSVDAGKTWLASRKIAATAAGSDYPVVAGYKDRAYLSWATVKEGHRVSEIAAQK